MFKTISKVKKMSVNLQRLEEKIDLLLSKDFPNSGERQVQTELKNVRADHRARYQKASEYIQEGDRVLDIACGIGYGSYMMSVQHASAHFTGVDISQKTIDFAHTFYKRKNIDYICDNCLDIELIDEHYDVIVSFETIEHIDADKQFLQKLHKALKKEGYLLFSTPNEEILPYDKDKHLYHVKHYTPSDIKNILTTCGFRIEKVFAQPDRYKSDITAGWNGMFNIVIAKKL